MARPRVVNAVMTSGTATPAGNYRTENIILHSQWHAHTCTSAHTWSLHEEHGKQAHQVPIHQADAVFNTWAYAPAEDPNFKNTRKKLVILKINKINTNCVKFLIIVIRQFWNTINSKAMRRLLLHGYTGINCKCHPSGMQGNISTEKDILLYFVGSFQTHIAHF